MIYSSLYIEASKSPSNSYLQLIPDHDGAIDAGKTLSFTVKATESVSIIAYQVYYFKRYYKINEIFSELFLVLYV